MPLRLRVGVIPGVNTSIEPRPELQQSAGLYAEGIESHFQLGDGRADFGMLSDLLLQRP
jgi:hypothetical protein